MRAATSRDGNRSRARQKQEIAQLRDTVAQLEHELMRLRRHSHPRQEPFATQWREIAERERHERYAAVAENAKLRHKTERQLRIAKKLKAALHARHHMEVVSTLTDRAIPVANALGPSLLDNAVVVREMESSLSVLMAECGAAFQDAAFQRRSMDVHHVEKRETLEDGVHVVTAERRVWPFAREALSEAVLRVFGEMRAVRFAALDLQVRDDFASSDVAAVIEGTRFNGVSRVKILARRYDFESQTLVVFTGMTDPSHAIGTPCDGLLLRHKGWVRLRPLEGYSGATTYEAYHVAVPAAFDVVHDQKRKAALLTSFMQSTVGLQMVASRDGIEGFLLAKASQCRAH